ncbi:MAG: hypothetical protein RSB51_06410 [Clostridia bacterium]
MQIDALGETLKILGRNIPTVLDKYIEAFVLIKISENKRNGSRDGIKTLIQNSTISLDML